MTSHDLLFELGTEELPPKSLRRLELALAEALGGALRDAQFAFDDIRSFATPRRLAVIVSNLAGEQPEQHIEKRGPAVKAAWDEDGNPTRALEGFARGAGVKDLGQLETVETDKGAWVMYRAVAPGRKLGEVIPDLLGAALDKLPVERRMRWGSHRTEFVRPVHWVVLLHGNQVLPANILGITSDRVSRGHRFMADKAVTLDSPADYETKLEDCYVIADFNRRQTLIRDRVADVAASLDAELTDDEALLSEVTALVEWPVPLAGKFSADFLRVPEEALISAMREHQRYFHLRDKQGQLMPAFITVANIESTDPAAVVAGNERVILPRLSDADFFFRKDSQQPLADNLERLSTVVFQSQLGSFKDKAERVASLAGKLAEALDVDAALASRAGLLCKADLVTDMVGEFPDLQGIMGGYYASGSGEAEVVASAIREHYRPAFAGDVLPSSGVPAVVAIADKLDTIVGLFGIGEPPTGSKDPFALRRQCLGIIRIAIGNRLPLELGHAIDAAIKAHGREFDSQPVLAYFLERMSQWYIDQGVSADNFQAVRESESGVSNLLEADEKVRAIVAFRDHAQASDLVSANKRVANILVKSGEERAASVDPSRFEDPAEGALLEAINQYKGFLEGKPDFSARLAELARMQPVVNSYFDDVMVMSDDAGVRSNRLATLFELRSLFLTVADFSQLQA